MGYIPNKALLDLKNCFKKKKKASSALHSQILVIEKGQDGKENKFHKLPTNELTNTRFLFLALVPTMMKLLFPDVCLGNFLVPFSPHLMELIHRSPTTLY